MTRFGILTCQRNYDANCQEQLGRINLLTPAVTRAAQESEMKDGTVVSLKYAHL